MAAPIGPGDYVECVDATSLHQAFSHRPSPADAGAIRAGKVYVVERVGFGPVSGEPLLWLRGVLESIEGGYCAWRFKPIYKRDETLTARLLSHIPADAPASPEEVVA